MSDSPFVPKLVSCSTADIRNEMAGPSHERCGRPAVVLRILAAGVMALGIAATTGPGFAADAAQQVSDSATAKQLLKAMSDYLAAQKSISFGYDSTLEVVTKDDQKLGLASSGTVTLSRPDKIRATRAGGFVDVESLFDGKTLTLFGKGLNKYTQAEIPGSIDHLIEEVHDKFNRPLPAADLLTTNAYDELMQGVYDAKDLGSGVIDGQECDSLAFRKDDVDWQIWIAQGDRPYPCRFVVTSRQVHGAPEYSVQIRDWKTGAEVPADDFAFKNSTGAEKVTVADLKDKIGDLPDNFKLGAKQ